MAERKSKIAHKSECDTTIHHPQIRQKSRSIHSLPPICDIKIKEINAYSEAGEGWATLGHFLSNPLLVQVTSLSISWHFWQN